MKSKKFASALRVLGWMSFYLLLSAPAFFMASAENNHSFVIRNARVFDAARFLVSPMSGSATARSRPLEKLSRFPPTSK